MSTNHRLLSQLACNLSVTGHRHPEGDELRVLLDEQRIEVRPRDHLHIMYTENQPARLPVRVDFAAAVTS